MLVVDDAPNGAVETCEHHAIGTRLGEGLEVSGAFAPAAIERNLAAVAAFAARARELGATLSCIATSAVRCARDADAFAMRVNEVTGVTLDVISGTREAEASFLGATYGADVGAGRVAVLDIGGGSTECAVGSDGVLEGALSLELGSVRLTERYPALAGGDPGATAHGAAREARAAIASALAPLRRFRPVAQVRCVAGTPLTVAAIAFESHVDRVRGRTLTRASIDATTARLLDSSLDARRELPGMIAQRADVIVAGALVLSEALAALDVDTGILESNDLLLGYLVMTRFAPPDPK
jgi:exopolyphosphatase/guanosine-5'-triphosphate,3'-diphosphate pyrophosphatase